MKKDDSSGPPKFLSKTHRQKSLSADLIFFIGLEFLDLTSSCSCSTIRNIQVQHVLRHVGSHTLNLMTNLHLTENTNTMRYLQ